MSIYDITVTKRENRQDVEVSLNKYQGKVLLIVNTATSCGLTPQYEALENLYKTHKAMGFEILDFPCNQFMEQAKGSDEEIDSFCVVKYNTTFPRFKKIDVNGENEAPLYTYLKKAIGKRQGSGSWFLGCVIALSSKLNGKTSKSDDIKWNFEKFLVDRQGNVVKRFAPTVTPEQIEKEIQELLQ